MIYLSRRLIIPYVFGSKYPIKVKTPKFLNTFLTDKIPKSFKINFKSRKDMFPYDFESDVVQISVELNKTEYEVKFTLEKRDRMAEIMLMIDPVEELNNLRIFLLDANSGEIRQIV